MIVIVDYGMGNLRSVQKAFERVGQPALISGDPRQIAKASKLVLPGVGAFGDAMTRLRGTRQDHAIRAFIDAGKPFLGICLGLQLLFTRSFEDGEHAGLGVLPGDVVRFQPAAGVKIPHMGWNQLRIRRGDTLLNGVAPDSSVYFVHSFYAAPSDAGVIASETEYPIPFASAIESGRIFATQFHPEKSQAVGLHILHNFAKLS